MEAEMEKIIGQSSILPAKITVLYFYYEALF